MHPERGSAPAGTEAQEKQQPEAWSSNRNPSRRPLQDQLADRAESLGIAARICKRLSETLPAEQAQGAMECLIALRLEIERTLGHAGIKA